MLLTAQKVTACYEIWLFPPGQPPELLNLCGLFRSFADAAGVRDALRDWLRLGRWVDAVLDGLTAEACTDLFDLRQQFKADGIDPADVLAVVKRTTAEGLRIAFAAPDPDEDADPDDTDLVVSVPFSNCLDV